MSHISGYILNCCEGVHALNNQAIVVGDRGIKMCSVKGTQRLRVFMDITADGESLGRIVMEVSVTIPGTLRLRDWGETYTRQVRRQKCEQPLGSYYLYNATLE
ncbi:hypothetical protein chiPu_0023521 [Chiloscyllium punctatum]|uniref:Uncharacterized protein n=1 Tax=Chiloscyllium punctatum TaxID=137246 RepID=A0A401TBK7_CHIPU|nr:hypothetical protein [Chiloscyllium punctatum]